MASATATTGNSDHQIIHREEQAVPVALAEVEEDSSRIVKPIVGSGWLVVSANNVVLQASNLIAVTPAELKNVLTSVETKKGATIDPEILNFPQLLKCVEVVKNGDDHQELFLRATTHESDGLIRKRRGDQNRMFSLHLATLLLIKEKFRANFYASSELSPAEIKTLDTFFDEFIGDDPIDIEFKSEGDLKKEKKKAEEAEAAGTPLPDVEDVKPPFRLLARVGDDGFVPSEIYKVKAYPTLASAPSIYAKKRMREDVIAEQAERAKLVRKLDAPDSIVGVLNISVPGKILSQVETEDGLIITYLKA